jgi:hypothetical protein
MRYVLPDDNGEPGLIDENRKKFLEDVFKAKESKYKHHHVIDCDIDRDKQIMIIWGHRHKVQRYIEKCIIENQTRYFKSAEVIILITCDLGVIKWSKDWAQILSGKLFTIKSDFGIFTKVDDYGFGFKATAFEAALYRAKEITTFSKFLEVAEKYVKQMN